jgi:hypothetical protein
MDEKSPRLTKGDILPEGDQVYRIVLANQRDKKNKKIPAIRCFSLSPDDNNMLSVDWEKRTTPEECIARFGGSFKKDTETYKPYENRELFALGIFFLNLLPVVEKVVYDPEIFDPPVKGRVNNPAHSLVVFEAALSNNSAQAPETLMKIRDHATKNKVEIDWDKVHELVKNYRQEQETYS